VSEQKLTPIEDRNQPPENAVADWSILEEGETTATSPAERLAALSAHNIADIRASYLELSVAKGQFSDAETAAVAVAQRTEAIAHEHRLTINMSADGIQRFMKIGRVETYWDHKRGLADESAKAISNKKDIHEHYDAVRLAVEQGMVQFAGTETSVEPVYTAIAGPHGRDAIAGAAPDYGNWWLEMDPSVEAAAVYSFADSHAAVTMPEEVDGEVTFAANSLLNKQDAMEAKAIVDLAAEYHRSKNLVTIGSMAFGVDPSVLMHVQGKGAGYVEGVLFEAATEDKVAAIRGRIDRLSQLAELGAVLTDPDAMTDKLRVDIYAALDPASQQWLAEHYPQQVKLMNDTKPSVTIDALEIAGLNVSADYNDIAKSLADHARQLQKRMNVRLMLPAAQTLINFKDDGQWSAYMRTLDANREKLDRKGQAVIVDQLIAVQQARIFFKEQAAA